MATAFASQEIAQLLSKGLLFGALDDDARLRARRPRGRAYDAAVPHLDQRATGSRHIAELRVDDLTEIEDHRFAVVVLVPQHRREGRRADDTEFHWAVRR